MYFVTNRKLSFGKGSGITAGLTSGVQFDIDDNIPSQQVYFCERMHKSAYIEIGSEKFLNNLKNGPAKHYLFYIHGFSNLPEPDIFPRVEQLQALFNEYGDEDEPVEVIPVIWPCDNDFGITLDYFDDQKSADASAIAFSRVLQKFWAWSSEQDTPCVKRMNILAHSMGNRVLRGAFEAWAKYEMNNGLPLLFRNIFMAAADVKNECLESNKAGEHITEATRNVVVYHASDDLALRASKISNLKNKVASRRLGHSGPEDMSKTPKNVYAVDCDDINSSYDNPKGHAYFLDNTEGKAGAVFKHMLAAISTGRLGRDKEIILRDLK